MPCNSDYMEPNKNEMNLSKVYALLDEIKTGKQPTKDFGIVCDRRAYGQVHKFYLDEKTE